MPRLESVRPPVGGAVRPDCLKGRVVLITGATGGVGRAAAIAAAGAGATAVLLGRKVRALEKLYDAIEAGGGSAALYPLDLEGASPRDYEEMAQTFEREFGRLDGIVHAAAHFAGLQPLAAADPLDWLRTLHVNLSAPFLLTQACMSLLVRAADASVVFVLEDFDRIARAHWGAYGVGKHALAGLVAILHDETDSGPVRVHALLPPPLRTALRRTAYFGENSLELPQPDSIAPALVYLLSVEAVVARGKILDLRAWPSAEDSTAEP